MKVSTYTTAFNAVRYNFDIKGALDNWATYSDEISVAVNTCDDGTYEAFESYAKERGYNVVITRTEFDMSSDPFAYGKIENAALQACTGSLMVQCNLDERFRCDRAKLEGLNALLSRSDARAFWVPTIDLYGSYERAARISRKWYIHGSHCFRGAARVGIKPDGRPDYNKTSTDELLDNLGNLVPAVPILQGELTIENLRPYVAAGWPISYHLGYFDLKSRADRAKWWGEYWRKATGGDANNHITDVAELEKRHTFEHGLPLWESK